VIASALLALLEEPAACGLPPERLDDVLRQVALIEEAARERVVQAQDRAAVVRHARQVRQAVIGTAPPASTMPAGSR
jgi:hypothetical protein